MALWLFQDTHSTVQPIANAQVVKKLYSNEQIKEVFYAYIALIIDEGKDKGGTVLLNNICKLFLIKFYFSIGEVRTRRQESNCSMYLQKNDKKGQCR